MKTMRLPLFLAALLLAPAAPLRAEPPPEPTPAPQEVPSPAPVYARPLDEQGRAAPPPAAPAAPEGPTIDSVLSTLRQIGMLSASAVLMLLGSALAGAALAGLVLLIRKRRAAASVE